MSAPQIAAYLIASPEGHVLIDGAMAESAPQIAANIAHLGFRIEDVRWLLNNHPIGIMPAPSPT
ncbi:MAG: hypothetical protein ACXWUR_08980 [Allosphingosinicella sp.]